MKNKIVKKPTKKSESLAQRVITLEKKVLKLEKQVSHLKEKETPKKMENIPDVGLMQKVVAEVRDNEPPIK